ncbi:MAG: hypothetical protein AAF938_20680, partial [Myxococcota bacterium]
GVARDHRFDPFGARGADVDRIVHGQRSVDLGVVDLTTVRSRLSSMVRLCSARKMPKLRWMYD